MGRTAIGQMPVLTTPLSVLSNAQVAYIFVFCISFLSERNLSITLGALFALTPLRTSGPINGGPPKTCICVLGALVRRTCPPARAGGAECVPAPAEEEDERWRERPRSQLFAATAGSKPASRRRPSRWQREKSTADRRGHDRAERPGPRPSTTGQPRD